MHSSVSNPIKQSVTEYRDNHCVDFRLFGIDRQWAITFLPDQVD